VNKADLMTMNMTVEELQDLLVLALQAHELGTKNMISLTERLRQAHEEIEGLKSEKLTLEAKILVLENRP
jgi:hypothetical protein